MTGRAAFGALRTLRDTPIPDQSEPLARKAGFRGHPIEDRDPAFGDELVEIGDYGLRGENFYASDRNPPHYSPIPGSIPELWVRRGVAERLSRVQRRLGQAGLALWLFDGWRPNQVQRYFHDDWMPRVLRALDPAMSRDAVTEEVQTYWSAPTIDPAAPAPHLTGGAVDLTLVWADSGQPLWMGSIFDDVSPVAALAHFETHGTGLAMSADEARANRRLLYWTMTGAGFCANPSEWWHFSHGDQMWARLTGAPAATYGATAPGSRRAAA